MDDHVDVIVTPRKENPKLHIHGNPLTGKGYDPEKGQGKVHNE